MNQKLLAVIHYPFDYNVVVFTMSDFEVVSITSFYQLWRRKYNLVLLLPV